MHKKYFHNLLAYKQHLNILNYFFNFISNLKKKENHLF